MSTAGTAGFSSDVADELVALTAELYELLSAAERALSRAREHPGYARLEARTAHLLERFAKYRGQKAHDITDAIERASANLRAFTQELGAKNPGLGELRARWQSLGHDYETMVEHIRGLRLRVPRHLELGRIKPRNFSRNLFHVANGVFAVLLYELVLTREMVLVVGSAVLASFIALDIARRLSPRLNDRLIQKTFAWIARPHEAHRVPAATWYLLALVVGAAILPQHAIEVGCIVLAFGDPAAALAGKRWGQRKLIGDKTLAGLVAFALVAAIAAVALLLLVGSPLPAWRLCIIALGAAAAGGVAELVSQHVDDNLTVPLLAGGVAALLLI